MRLAVPTTKNTNEVGNSKQDDWTGQKIKTFLCSSDIYFSSRAVWPDGKIIYSSFDCLEKGKIAQWLEIFAKVGSKYSQVKLNLKYCPRLLQFYQSSEIWPNLVTLIRVLRDGYEEDKSQWMIGSGKEGISETLGSNPAWPDGLIFCLIFCHFQKWKFAQWSLKFGKGG